MALEIVRRFSFFCKFVSFGLSCILLSSNIALANHTQTTHSQKNDHFVLAPRSITDSEEGQKDWTGRTQYEQVARSKGKIIFLLSSALGSTGAIVVSFIQYTSAFHILAAFSIVALTASITALAYVLANPETQKKIASVKILLPVTLFAAGAIRLFPIARFPWMDEVFYTAKGMDGLLHGVWDSKMTELPYTWSALAGLTALTVHPLYGPKLLAIIFSVGTIYLVHKFTTQFLTVADGMDQRQRSWVGWVAALIFGFSSSAIYTGMMSVHDVMAAFCLMLSMVLLNAGEMTKSVPRARAYSLTSQVVLLVGMYSKYAMFVYGPFYLLYALALRIDTHSEISLRENLKAWFIRTALPLGVMTIGSAFHFRHEIAEGYQDSKDAIVKLAKYVVFPRLTILNMMFWDIAPYLFFGGLALIGKFKNTWTKIPLFLLGMTSLYDHLARGHIQGMVKHYAFVLGLLSPLIATGVVSTVDFVRQRLKPAVRLIPYAVFAALFGYYMRLPYTGSMSWWMYGDAKPTESARVIKRYLSRGKKFAAREYTPAFVMGLDHRSVVLYKAEKKLDPSLIINDPEIEIVELYPEEAALALDALLKAGFEKIYEGTPLVLRRMHSANDIGPIKRSELRSPPSPGDYKLGGALPIDPGIHTQKLVASGL